MTNIFQISKSHQLFHSGGNFLEKKLLKTLTPEQYDLKNVLELMIYPFMGI